MIPPKETLLMTIIEINHNVYKHINITNFIFPWLPNKLTSKRGINSDRVEPFHVNQWYEIESNRIWRRIEEIYTEASLALGSCLINLLLQCTQILCVALTSFVKLSVFLFQKRNFHVFWCYYKFTYCSWVYNHNHNFIILLCHQ